MKTERCLGLLLCSVFAGCLIQGCAPQPTVVTTPGNTTVIHDRPARAPNVTVVTPAAPPSTHTETNTTNTVPPPTTGDPGAGTSTSTTTTTGG